MNKNKIIFTILYVFILSLGFITIYKSVSSAHVVHTNAYISNVAQRLFGLTIYSMLFVQIILGAFMTKLTDKFGGWIFKFHVWEGITIYTLVLGHITSFILFNYFTGHGLDPFYVIADVCILCDKLHEYYLTFGRLAFWFMTTSVSAALLRTQTQFLRVHWKKFHYLNYFVFLFAGIHSLGVGSDIGTAPFSFFHGPALVIIAGLGIYKIVKFLKIARIRNSKSIKTS